MIFVSMELGSVIVPVVGDDMILIIIVELILVSYGMWCSWFLLWATWSSSLWSLGCHRGFGAWVGMQGYQHRGHRHYAALDRHYGHRHYGAWVGVLWNVLVVSINVVIVIMAL